MANINQKNTEKLDVEIISSESFPSKISSTLKVQSVHSNLRIIHSQFKKKNSDKYDDRGYFVMLLEWSGGGWRWEGVSQPRSRKLSIASCADLHHRTQSSWRNHISSHGAAAELGPPPEPQKNHLFYTTKEKEIQAASGQCECARTYVCVCVWVCLWGVGWGGNLGNETEEGNHRRITSEGRYVSVKHLSLWNCSLELLTPSDLSASVGASCLLLPCRTPSRFQPNRASHPLHGG